MLVLFEPNAIDLDPELQSRSSSCVETRLLSGESLGYARDTSNKALEQVHAEEQRLGLRQPVEDASVSIKPQPSALAAAEREKAVRLATFMAKEAMKRQAPQTWCPSLRLSGQT